MDWKKMKASIAQERTCGGVDGECILRVIRDDVWLGDDSLRDCHCHSCVRYRRLLSVDLDEISRCSLVGGCAIIPAFSLSPPAALHAFRSGERVPQDPHSLHLFPYIHDRFCANSPQRKRDDWRVHEALKALSQCSNKGSRTLRYLRPA